MPCTVLNAMCRRHCVCDTYLVFKLLIEKTNTYRILLKQGAERCGNGRQGTFSVTRGRELEGCWGSSRAWKVTEEVISELGLIRWKDFAEERNSWCNFQAKVIFLCSMRAITMVIYSRCLKTHYFWLSQHLYKVKFVSFSFKSPSHRQENGGFKSLTKCLWYLSLWEYEPDSGAKFFLL